MRVSPPATEATARAPAIDIRPRWRGVIHRWAAPIGIALFVPLIARAETAGVRIALVVYAAGMTAMLGVSAIYHSGKLTPLAARRMKRVDHSTILVAIAGTYTAVTTLALDGTARVAMLVAIWVAAVVGVAVRMVWLDAPYPVSAGVYLVAGWLVLADLPGYVRGLSGAQLALLIAGGTFYTVGGVVYALHRPNPWPLVFGYHEVFHALVVLGALCHYACVFGLTDAART